MIGDDVGAERRAPTAHFLGAPRSALNWGVLGCGWVARDYVIPALLASANGRVVALCDRDPSALARALPHDAGGGRAGTPPERHTSVERFLATPGLDAVYVATPNASHAALVTAAAGAGKHVLCEKPMAPSAAEADAMVAACERAGVAYATAFDQRYQARHRRLRALVAAGALGRVTCVRIHYACWTPGDWSPDGAPHDNWRVDPARAGGGSMIDLAPHGLDLAQYLVGEPITTVACLTQRRVFDYPVDDGAVIVARTSGGVLVSHTVAYNRPDAFPRRELEVIGDRGRALAVNTMGQTAGGTLSLMGPDGVAHEVAVPPHEDRSPFLAQVEAFAGALLSGHPFEFPAAHDLHTMRLVEACGREEMAAVAPPAARPVRQAAAPRPVAR